MFCRTDAGSVSRGTSSVEFGVSERTTPAFWPLRVALGWALTNDSFKHNNGVKTSGRTRCAFIELALALKLATCPSVYREAPDRA